MDEREFIEQGIRRLEEADKLLKIAIEVLTKYYGYDKDQISQKIVESAMFRKIIRKIFRKKILGGGLNR
ncbi:MAG: hypothetical protein ACTSXJ_09345 [Candidatus Baldrarchaeia archaeon]